MSSINAFAIGLVNLTSIKVTPSMAGRRVIVHGGDSRKDVTAHLYGPGRTTDEEAAIPDLKLPSPLTPGAYTLKAWRDGDPTDAHYEVSFDVTDATVSTHAE